MLAKTRVVKNKISNYLKINEKENYIGGKGEEEDKVSLCIHVGLELTMLPPQPPEC
jgi:hypothetical protein